MPDYNSNAICLVCAEPDDTAGLAARLAKGCPEAVVVFLRGDLGAGKSAFARSFLQALGVLGSIKSPTYTLIESYPLADGLSAVHMDLYRIADADELDYLALDEVLQNTRALLVEWPDIGLGHLPKPDVCIDISMHVEGRALCFTAMNSRAQAWLAVLTA